MMDSSVALKWMLSCPPLVLRVPCTKIVVVGITGGTDPQQASGTCSALCGPSFLSAFLFATCRMSKYALNLDRRRYNILALSPCTTSDDCGVLEVWFVASMRFVGNRQLVHHTHEDDAVEVRLWRTLFSTRVVSRGNVLL